MKAFIVLISMIKIRLNEQFSDYISIHLFSWNTSNILTYIQKIFIVHIPTKMLLEPSYHIEVTCLNNCNDFPYILCEIYNRMIATSTLNGTNKIFVIDPKITRKLP